MKKINEKKINNKIVDFMTIAANEMHVDVYKCKTCSNIYEDSDEAEDCCPKTNAEPCDAFKCPICNEIFELFDEAKECCEWNYNI